MARSRGLCVHIKNPDDAAVGRPAGVQVQTLRVSGVHCTGSARAVKRNTVKPIRGEGGDRPIIVVLDYPSSDAALALVERLDPKRCNVKVGKELFTVLAPTSCESTAGFACSSISSITTYPIP